MRYTMLAALLVLMAPVALSEELTSATGEETAMADKATVETVAAARTPGEVEIPPGFKVKKRGDMTVYCTKGRSTGTRFVTETCYDENQLREYVFAREQANRDLNQSRGVCSNPGVCTSP